MHVFVSKPFENYMYHDTFNIGKCFYHADLLSMCLAVLQFLPIPELMPFRLTRQLRNIMLPMQEKGLMDGVMIHTLSAMRRNIHILLSTMDIFIKEPSLDWKVCRLYIRFSVY